MRVCWLGHASFLISNKHVLYVDPWNIKPKEKADIIFVTHAHYDHCDPDAIRLLSSSDTVVVAPLSCQSKLPKKDFSSVHWVKPGDRFEEKGIGVEAIAAYNVHRSFHPKSDQGVGYVIACEGKRIYHAGDTDFIPEMKALKAIDIALLPVSGTYVMSAEEAAEAANSFKPKKVIPMHYGSIVGTRNDAVRFQSLTHCDVEIQ